ncbi:MAG TPA: NADH-quinone oxidoreductase subunit C [Anaerolineales bacterium]
MNENLQPVVDTLKERFDAQVTETGGEVDLTLAAGQIVEACRMLREELGFELLADETAVDYWPQTEPRFHVVYHIRSLSKKLVVGLRVPLDGNDPAMPSITGIYYNANWFERELWDMFGIHFDGHPDLRRILMPYDWEGHPLRKDYPLGYEEVQFTFNFDEIMVRKQHPKD